MSYKGLYGVQSRGHRFKRSKSFKKAQSQRPYSVLERLETNKHFGRTFALIRAKKPLSTFNFQPYDAKTESIFVGILLTFACQSFSAWPSASDENEGNHKKSRNYDLKETSCLKVT